ncbi:CPBP family intramembrane glutamic endopeptidase [Fodinicola acaciae]|uniref:CPBP family intramembrane glutamic endopeptidase n=1 Tax=Fodinicola acaciae TaxID=2681555 RepID=UPI0013D64B58|nr:CPBP family intramembrane glutamic endopeptidase [Fodinicola acaciae]
MDAQTEPDLSVPPRKREWWRGQPHRLVTSVLDLLFVPAEPVPYARATRPWKIVVALVTALLFGPLLWATTATLALNRGGPTSPVAGIDLRHHFVAAVLGGLLQAALLFFAVGVAWVVLRLSGDRLLDLGLRPGPAPRLLADSGLTLSGLYLPALLVGGLVATSLRLGSGDVLVTPTMTGGDATQAGKALLVGLLLAIPTAVAEEVVALGLAYRLLERLGWPVWLITLGLVALRASYHVYYGLTVVALLGWAYLSVVFYRRYRRLWPLIIAHAAYDTLSITAALSGSLAVAGVVVLLYLALPIVALTVLLARLGLRWGQPRPSTDLVRPRLAPSETVAQ